VTTTIDVLVRALHDRDVSVRAEAVELPGLLATSPNDGTRKKVAAVLGWALEDGDPGLRLQAMEELGRIEAKYAHKYLNLALKDRTPSSVARSCRCWMHEKSSGSLLPP
jgi:HEAT repeat protein